MGQELATRQTSAILWSEPQFSATLGRALDLSRNERLEDYPLVSKDDRAAIPGLIEQLERGLAGTDPVTVEAMVARLSIAFPMQKASDSEASAKLELYVDGLRDIPQDILRNAFRAAVKECKFFPTVKELRDLAAPEWGRRRATLFRLNGLAQRFDDSPAPRDDLMPPDVAIKAFEKLSKRLSRSLTTSEAVRPR